MNVTTVHGIISMDFVSGDHGRREHHVPLPHRYCDSRVYDNEGERKRIPSMAYQSRTVYYRNCAHPRFSCHGVVLWMVGTLYHAFAGGWI